MSPTSTTPSTAGSPTNTTDLANPDLTFCVLLNLAARQAASGMLNEALTTYTTLVKNKVFAQSGILRVNIGNIYFQQGKFLQAIKMYRMALDQLPSTNQAVR